MAKMNELVTSANIGQNFDVVLEIFNLFSDSVHLDCEEYYLA